MWVQIIETYIGPLGEFLSDTKLDLPEKTAKSLIESKNAVQTTPPWDEYKKDEK